MSGPTQSPVDPAVGDLVRRAQAELPYGTAAFEELAASRYPAVRRLARAITGDADAADTIAQDSMLRVFHALTGLRDVATFDVWLRQIVTNTARSHLATEQRERDKAARFRGLMADEDASSDDVSGRTESDAFGALVSGLRLEERTVLAFRIVDDLPFPDIARILGISESGAKMRYRRAIERLRLRSRVGG